MANQPKDVRLKDGFSTIITFEDFPTVSFFEMTITPGGIEGGGPTETTTMRNIKWRTREPKFLKTLTEGTFTAAFKTDVFDTIDDIVNVKQRLTVTFPDGATYSFFGWLDNFSPNEFVVGEQPTAELTFIPSNTDLLGVEVDPVYTP